MGALFSKPKIPTPTPTPPAPTIDDARLRIEESRRRRSRAGAGRKGRAEPIARRSQHRSALQRLLRLLHADVDPGGRRLGAGSQGGQGDHGGESGSRVGSVGSGITVM